MAPASDMAAHRRQKKRVVAPTDPMSRPPGCLPRRGRQCNPGLVVDPNGFGRSGEPSRTGQSGPARLAGPTKNPARAEFSPKGTWRQDELLSSHEQEPLAVVADAEP